MTFSLLHSGGVAKKEVGELQINWTFYFYQPRQAFLSTSPPSLTSPCIICGVFGVKQYLYAQLCCFFVNRFYDGLIIFFSRDFYDGFIIFFS